MNAHRNRPTSIASLREAGTDVNLPIWRKVLLTMSEISKQKTKSKSQII
jgi:hypothetical protein